MLIDQSLNLARKWRVDSFEQVVGQEIVVRLLKNSLYSGHLFPVYLFVGQHGSGKTSTARIFAAAVNCQRLVDFRKAPKNFVIPCHTCESCLAFMEAGHPDFIEIDAASYTGVDSVRAIIESASYMPVLGQKRIYLIDEAHMLSKSAFNALLKILEEPPMSVLFMLATTESEKILETVRSRCFQLIFSSLQSTDLATYVTDLCKKENIVCDKDGAHLLATASGGSVRDALNLIERVRFSVQEINAENVLRLLRYPSDDQLLELIQVVWAADVALILKTLSVLALGSLDIMYVWRRLQELLRALLWCKYGIVLDDPLINMIVHDLSKKLSIAWLYQLSDLLYKHELQFHKSLAQAPFLEHLLLQKVIHDVKDKRAIEGGFSSDDLAFKISKVDAEKKNAEKKINDEQLLSTMLKKDQQQIQHNVVETAVDFITTVHDASTENINGMFSDGEQDLQPVMWQQFLVAIKSNVDAVVATIFSQARVDFSDNLNVTCRFTVQQLFFKDLLNDQEKTWRTQFGKIFGTTMKLCIEFTLQEAVQKELISGSVSSLNLSSNIENKSSIKKHVDRSTTSTHGTYVRDTYKNSSGLVKGHSNLIDVSDQEKWPKINLILRYVPGIVTRIAAQEDL